MKNEYSMENQFGRSELFQRYLEGDLTADEECETLHMIAEDPEMRSMLRFERDLFRTINREMTPDAFEVPEGFSDRVMHEISDRESEINRLKSLPERVQRGLKSLFLPKKIQFRPVYAIAALFLITLLFLFVPPQGGLSDLAEGAEGMAQPDRSVQLIAEEEQDVWIRFIFFDEEAVSVAVAGDFSEWDPVALDREIIEGRQVWTGLVPVTRGEQRYMFIKDGEEWVTDPLAEITRDDGFGNQNAVLIL